MRTQIKQHLSNYVAYFDAIEILTLAAGVVFVAAIATVFYTVAVKGSPRIAPPSTNASGLQFFQILIYQRTMPDSGITILTSSKIFEIDMINNLRAFIGAAACIGLAVIFAPGFVREIEAGVIPFSTIHLGNEDGGLAIDSANAGCPHYSWPYGCDWRPPAGEKKL